jgi:mono/diheme cytochrome c family protein
MLASGLALATATAMGADAERIAAVHGTYQRQIRPLLETYCVQCHRADKSKGDLDLDQYRDAAAASRAPGVWREVAEKVHRLEMPPPKEAKQPSAGERAAIIAWVASLRAIAPPDPGRVVARRLNRVEYDHTIRDLFGVDWSPAADFPPDDISEGFDNLAAALTVSPLLMEKYLAAADAILDKAIIAEQVDLTWAGSQLVAAGAKPTAVDAAPGPRTLVQAGEVGIAFGAPRDGRYQIKLRLAGELVGKEPPRVAVKVDNQVLGEVKALAALRAPALLTVTTKLEPGQHQLDLVFLNPGSEDAKPAPDPKAKPEPKAKPDPKARAEPKARPPEAPPAKARTLLIESVELVGPPAPPASELQRRILIAKPGKDLPKREAARQIAERFAARAYRRPPTAYETGLLLRVFDLADGAGDVFEESVKLMLKAALLSPQFLFRIERDHAADADGAYALDDWELASRLSYFLWSSLPDDELAALAAASKLHDPAVLAQQAKRLLADRRAHALAENFAGQWLQLRGVLGIQPDEKLFPGFDQALRQALLDEGVMLFETVLREGRPFAELLDADYVFVNERLAKFYGMAGISGPQLRQVPAPDRNRGGVLGLAAMLASTSNPTRTSPVKRGKWVLEQLLDQAPPPPPPDVAPLDKQPATSTSGAALSMRQRLEHHRSDSACAGCHATMDAIGFGLENFDPVGRWRDADAGIPIDAAGVVAGHGFNGPAGLKATLLARQDEVLRTLVRKLLTYAIGRAPIDADDAAIERIVASGGDRLPGLIAALVASYPFRYRHAAPGGTAANDR